jgi:curli biogenesis system outer membrane secretion channel CsgG
MLRSFAVVTAGLALLLAACAPTAEVGSVAPTAALDAPCATEPPPVVAVIEFENTTGRYGTTVTGVEEAATARLITLMKESGCYELVEQSELQNVMMQQGLESMAPEALAEAAGAGYVVTGTVTRATIAAPGVSVFGVSLGETRADVEVDVRATDIITGGIVVSETGRGTASSPNIAVDRIPGGRIAFDDPTVGPILADASAEAVREVVAYIRAEF